MGTGHDDGRNSLETDGTSPAPPERGPLAKATIARTGATGVAMLPDLVPWSTSLTDDLHFRSWDVLGSAAHVTMLAPPGLVAADDARQLRDALLGIFPRRE